MSNKKTLTIEDARNYVKSREENYRAIYGEALLCVSLTRGVVSIGIIKAYRPKFFETARHHATDEDPVFVGTIDDFMDQSGEINRIYGEKGNKYARGKYGGICA